jgi:hypothetical protein
MGGIIWLASYPKSGNTWLRAFLRNYRDDGEEPADINELGSGPIASARSTFDDEVGVEASDLTEAEIERYRPQVYRQMAENSQETLFLKIHDAYTYTVDELPLIPREATEGVVYIIRNPLDVALSFAHHSGVSADRMIARMGDAAYAFADNPNRLHNQLRQRLLTWSGHVLSWVDEAGLRVHVVRYEDMHREPVETFAAAIRFAGLPEDQTRLEKAIAFSSFDRLQQQEKEHGFREKNPRAESFFRQGQVGAWRDVLTAEQANRMVTDHGDVMRRFGYLSEADEIVY